MSITLRQDKGSALTHNELDQNFIDLEAKKVDKTAYSEHSVLIRDGGTSPVALVIPEGRIIGRKAGGSIVALTAAEVKAILALAIADIDNLQNSLNGKAATVHSHAIADVTDLQDELDGKAPTVHTHAIADVTDLQDELDGKAPTSHTHSISDVTGLADVLAAKLDIVGSGVATLAAGTATVSLPSFVTTNKVLLSYQTNVNAGVLSIDNKLVGSFDIVSSVPEDTSEVLWIAVL